MRALRLTLLVATLACLPEIDAASAPAAAAPVPGATRPRVTQTSNTTTATKTGSLVVTVETGARGPAAGVRVRLLWDEALTGSVLGMVPNDRGVWHSPPLPSGNYEVRLHRFGSQGWPSPTQTLVVGPFSPGPESHKVLVPPIRKPASPKTAPRPDAGK